MSATEQNIAKGRHITLSTFSFQIVRRRGETKVADITASILTTLLRTPDTDLDRDAGRLVTPTLERELVRFFVKGQESTGSEK